MPALIETHNTARQLSCLSTAILDDKAHPSSLFKVLDAVPVDVVVRPNRLAQLGADNHTRSIRCRSTREEHDACACVGECRLYFSFIPPLV